MKLSVQECLSSVAKSYTGITGDHAMILEAMILDNINHVRVHTLHIYYYYNDGILVTTVGRTSCSMWSCILFKDCVPI